MENRLLINALQGKNDNSRAPIWIMRQAGRYLPQYRAMRSKYSFLDMVHKPELAAEVTLLPIRLLGFDAAIIFSDILVVAESLKVGLRFEEGIGPIIEKPLTFSSDIDNLPNPNPIESLHYVSDAIKMVKPQLQVPLIGFCGAPFTVASYLIEGGSSRDLKKTKQWMLRDPKSFHRLLDKIADCSIAYLKMQVAAGVDAVQIFDSWAHFLAHEQFREFSLAYLQKIVQELRKTEIPVILFCRGSSIFASQLAELAPAGISLDWQCDLLHMRKQIPHSIALQGNLDPDILYADATTIRKEARRLLKGMEKDPRYIFNLGHGIHPDIPIDSVRTLIECVQEL